MSEPRFSPDYCSLIDLLSSIRLIAFDFDGVMTDNTVYVLQDGTEAVRCHRGDGMGLQKLPPLGIKAVIVSTEINPVVTARARKLKIPCVQACENKAEILESLLREEGVSWTETAFVGNDINDLCCLEKVGLPIVVQDAHPDVIPYAKYRTLARGGQGAVREICDLLEYVRTRK